MSFLSDLKTKVLKSKEAFGKVLSSTVKSTAKDVASFGEAVSNKAYKPIGDFYSSTAKMGIEGLQSLPRTLVKGAISTSNKDTEFTPKFTAEKILLGNRLVTSVARDIRTGTPQTQGLVKQLTGKDISKEKATALVGSGVFLMASADLFGAKISGATGNIIKKLDKDMLGKLAAKYGDDAVGKLLRGKGGKKITEEAVEMVRKSGLETEQIVKGTREVLTPNAARKYNNAGARELNESIETIADNIVDDPKLISNPKPQAMIQAEERAREALKVQEAVDSGPIQNNSEIAVAVDKRMKEVISKTRKLIEQQDELRSAERTKRVAKAAEIRAVTPGPEHAARAATGALEGELPRVAGKAYRSEFLQTEVEGVFQKINASKLQEFEKINATSGLAKLLDTADELPTNTEMDALSQVVDPELMKEIADTKRITGLWNKIAESLNISKAITTSGDFSAPGRQGALLSTRAEYWKALPYQFKFAFNKKAYDGYYESIKLADDFDLIKSSKLDVVGLSGKHEEAFYGAAIIEKIPVLRKLSSFIASSERAYTGYLDKLRVDTFRSMVRSAAKNGVDVSEGSVSLKKIAKYLNDATGRTNLGDIPAIGKQLEDASELLNGVLYSPKFMASRVKLLNPFSYLLNPGMDPFVRKQAWRDAIGYVGAGIGILTFAKMNGAEVGTDPRSADFGRIKVGNTRYDIWGGFQPYVRLVAQLITGEYVSSSGRTYEFNKGYASQDRLMALERFGRGKLSPVASFVADWLAQEDYLGRKFDPKSAAAQRIFPMLYADIYGAAKLEGVAGAAKTTPAIFGIGVNTYESSSSGTPTMVAKKNPTIVKKEIPTIIKKEKPVARK